MGPKERVGLTAGGLFGLGISRLLDGRAWGIGRGLYPGAKL